jgi:hypothetical protein
MRLGLFLLACASENALNTKNAYEGADRGSGVTPPFTAPELVADPAWIAEDALCGDREVGVTLENTGDADLVVAALDLVQQVRRPDQAAVALALHDETVAIACDGHSDFAALDRREMKSTRELILFDGCAREVAGEREEVDGTCRPVDVDAKLCEQSRDRRRQLWRSNAPRLAAVVVACDRDRASVEYQLADCGAVAG